MSAVWVKSWRINFTLSWVQVLTWLNLCFSSWCDFEVQCWELNWFLGCSSMWVSSSGWWRGLKSWVQLQKWEVMEVEGYETGNKNHLIFYWTHMEHEGLIRVYRNIFISVLLHVPVLMSVHLSSRHLQEHPVQLDAAILLSLINISTDFTASLSDTRLLQLSWGQTALLWLEHETTCNYCDGLSSHLSFVSSWS